MVASHRGREEARPAGRRKDAAATGENGRNTRAAQVTDEARERVTVPAPWVTAGAGRCQADNTPAEPPVRQQRRQRRPELAWERRSGYRKGLIIALLWGYGHQG